MLTYSSQKLYQHLSTLRDLVRRGLMTHEAFVAECERIRGEIEQLALTAREESAK